MNGGSGDVGMAAREEGWRERQAVREDRRSSRRRSSTSRSWPSQSSQLSYPSAPSSHLDRRAPRSNSKMTFPSIRRQLRLAFLPARSVAESTNYSVLTRPRKQRYSSTVLRRRIDRFRISIGTDYDAGRRDRQPQILLWSYLPVSHRLRSNVTATPLDLR